MDSFNHNHPPPSGGMMMQDTKHNFISDLHPQHNQNHHNLSPYPERSPIDVKIDPEMMLSNGHAHGGMGPHSQQSRQSIGYSHAHENFNDATQQINHGIQHHNPHPPGGNEPPCPGYGNNYPGSPFEENSTSSPSPMSAAAEYMRTQDVGRGSPRKRIYQDWNQVTVFETPSEAEEGIKHFEGCRWKVGNKFTSREGFKVYWSCREGVGCPVQIHLLYHSQLPRVVLYRNQPSHHHAERIKTRGLSPEVESLIRELFNNGINKPRRIQFILNKKGLEEVPQTKLSNFLVKLRREAAASGNPVRKEGSNRKHYGDDFDDDENDFLSGEEKSNQASNSNSISPSSHPNPGNFLHGPNHHPNMLINPNHGPGGSIPHPHHHQVNIGYGMNNSSGFCGEGMSGIQRYPPISYHNNSGSGSGFSPRMNQGAIPPGYHEKIPACTSAADSKNQEDSEVSSSLSRSLYCRDETTEEGEGCLPDEDNVKEKIINHIRMNYSNRDMLHIRQELKTIKRENKYTALNRLLSFTAGFLQDTFLEKRPMTPDTDDGS